MSDTNAIGLFRGCSTVAAGLVGCARAGVSINPCVLLCFCSIYACIYMYS